VSGDDGQLQREILAVREASRPGELVAVTPEDGRSLARHVGRATVRYVLMGALVFVAALVLSMLLQ
jgi:hypothetical protein